MPARFNHHSYKQIILGLKFSQLFSTLDEGPNIYTTQLQVWFAPILGKQGSTNATFSSLEYSRLTKVSLRILILILSKFKRID